MSSDPQRTTPAEVRADADSQGPLDPTHPAAGPAPDGPAGAGEGGAFGRYHILRKLGRGGMGAVYLGHDPALERNVALKVMLPQYAADPESRERFLREARAAAKVKSDHVVTIFDVGEAGGVPFIAMEYLLGLPLDQFLKTRGELPLEQVLRVARETALGLSAAHAMGLIHRDVKPANIWLEAPRGRVKLLDFGLARAQADDEQLTGRGAVLGTPAYMSPEQARGLPVDHRTDLFSLGVMLYRLCTGKMPFVGVGTMGVLTALAVDTPVAPRAHNPQLPDAVAAIVDKLLAKNPAERFQSAREVVAALDAAAADPRPHVVAVPAPMDVGAQAQNVWDGIDDSGSVAVPLAEAETESEPRPPVAPPKWPLWAAGAAALLVVAVAAAVLRPKPKVESPPVAEGPLPGPTVRPSVPTPKPTPGPAQESADPDRAAAEWVLAAGGTVGINGETDTLRFLRGRGDLPREPFELTSASFYKRRPTSDGFALLAKCAGLRSLWLQQAPVADADLAPFAGVAGLTHLYLSDVAVTDAGLAHFAGCKGLTYLNLATLPGVTAAGLAAFAGCDKLTYLRLVKIPLTDDGLAAFRGCTRLTHLYLSDKGVTDAGVRHFDDLPDLTALGLEGTQVTAAGLARFKGCRKLTSLGLLGTTGVGDAGLALFADHKLTGIDLRNIPITDAGLKLLAGHKGLRSLDLAGTSISDKGLVHLTACERLHSIDLRNRNITAAGLEHLKGLKALTRLDVRDVKVTEKDVRAFAESRRRCRVEWDGGIIGPLDKPDPERTAAERVIELGGEVNVSGAEAAFERAADLPPEPFVLTAVRIRNNPDLTAADLAPLAACGSLQTLDLRDCPVTDAGLYHFRAAKTIAYLLLDNTALTDAGLEHFRGCKNLEHLSLVGTAATDAGLAHFREHMKLLSLSVRGTKVTAEAAAAVRARCPKCVIDILDDPKK